MSNQKVKVVFIVIRMASMLYLANHCLSQSVVIPCPLSSHLPWLVAARMNLPRFFCFLGLNVGRKTSEELGKGGSVTSALVCFIRVWVARLESNVNIMEHCDHF